jgi:dienelactone hydrolase
VALNMNITRRRAIGPVVALSAVVLAAACSQSLKLAKDDSPTVLSHQTITAPNPGEPGSFRVKRMYYGSGTDRQRHEYRDSVTIKTRTVDVSPYATVGPQQADDRKKWWGFDMKKVPLNGRVWYPEGDGPFPLVLVVHGNHNPQDFSDPGYGYLGELLASRGFILVSVDENFINGLSGENDGRAWLLLKHLEQWKHFNDSAGSPFQHRVDMTNIAVMGHSRGGEAAPLAAAFNRLKYYPDDAKEKFNFGFAIKAVMAIAPVDGQYKAASQYTPLDNVNYLVIHGSHDGDVTNFNGLRQYERLRFTDGKPWFKSAIFMYRANHGQWNTVWGNKDNGPRSGRFLDLRALIDPEAQRQFAKVVISAFLEASLHNRREYLPLFRDHRTAGAWLPKTMYTTRFEENGYHPLAEFDEDIDLTTGTTPGVVLAGDSLATWKENVLPFRGRGGDDQKHNAVWLGWNNHIAGTDTTKFGKPASYSITLPDSVLAAWRLSEQGAVYLSVAATNDKPGPRTPARDTTKKDSTKADSAKKKAAPPKPPPKKKEVPDSTPLELSVEVTDAAGNSARLPLSRYGVLRRPLDTRVYRRAGRDAQRFATIFELIPQTFVLPLADFARSAPQFVPARLRTIRLVFDRSVAGTVVVTDIGVSTPTDPAFLAAPVP